MTTPAPLCSATILNLLDRVSIKPLPIAERANECRKPEGGNRDGEDGLKALYVSGDDNGYLLGSEGLADLCCTSAEDDCGVSPRKVDGEVLDELVVEGRLCR